MRLDHTPKVLSFSVTGNTTAKGMRFADLRCANVFLRGLWQISSRIGLNSWHGHVGQNLVGPSIPPAASSSASSSRTTTRSSSSCSSAPWRLKCLRRQRNGRAGSGSHELAQAEIAQKAPYRGQVPDLDSPDFNASDRLLQHLKGHQPADFLTKRGEEVSDKRFDSISDLPHRRTNIWELVEAVWLAESCPFA